MLEPTAAPLLRSTVGGRSDACRALHPPRPRLWLSLRSLDSTGGTRRETRHLPRSACVFHGEHGRLREGGQGAWAGGQGDSNETLRPSRGVGGGRGVRAQASWGHQEEDCGRRPRACEKRGTKVPRERASCTRVDTCGTGEMGTDAAWSPHGAQPKVLSRMPSKGHVRFSTGAMRKRAC